MNRILLSIPHMSGLEQQYIQQAFDSNWLAPLGPNVEAFEREICQLVGVRSALALNSATAALHLALCVLGVGEGDSVFCSTSTFIASVNPVLYLNARPVFIDSEPCSWNMSPEALAQALTDAQNQDKLPKAIIVANLYGQSAKYDELCKLANQYKVPVIEDAAESLGASYQGKPSGTWGTLGVYSFNGNKIITTTGGGMLISDDEKLIDKARFLSTQAKLNKPYYLHECVGYNYRLSNVLAGIGRGQLQVLEQRVDARRKVFDNYANQLAHLSCLQWMPEMPHSTSTRWLSTCLLDPQLTAITPQQMIDYLDQHNIEARRTWNPMHRQPLFTKHSYYEHTTHGVADYLFEHGVCLPSSSNLSVTEQSYVIDKIATLFAQE